MGFLDKDEKGRGPLMRFITRDVIDMEEIEQKHDVLLVCEEEYILKYMTNVVDGGGILVPHTAKNGAEAVFKFVSVNPSVVVLDYDLTEPDAVETMKNLLQLDPKVGILICIQGGRKGKQIAQTFLDAGAAGWVDKPITSTVLIEKIIKIVDAKIKAEKKAKKEAGKSEK